MDSDTEIDIEDIEAEISAGGETVGDLLVVFALFLIFQIETEHSERDMERDILHDEDLHAGRKVELRLHGGGMRGAHFPVKGSVEPGAAGGESEFHLIIDAEPAMAAEAEILIKSNGGGV